MDDKPELQPGKYTRVRAGAMYGDRIEETIFTIPVPGPSKPPNPVFVHLEWTAWRVWSSFRRLVQRVRP